MNEEVNNDENKKNTTAVPSVQNKPQHPPLHYSVMELQMIRRESINHSSDLIIKRLHRCFQRIKKFKDAKREKELNEPYEAESSQVRRDFRKLHQLYKNGSKIPQITQLKIDKMRQRVEKSKAEVNRDETCLARDIDLSRLYLKFPSGQKSQSNSK